VNSVTYLASRAGLIAIAATVLGSMSGCSLLQPHRKPVRLAPDDPILVSCAYFTDLEPESLQTSDPGSAKGKEEAEAARKKAIADALTALKLGDRAGTPGGVNKVQASLALCRGIVRAEGYHQAYFDAVRDHSGFRNAVGLLTIPLAGLAIREGLDNNPTAAKIKDAGVLSAILYGWSTAFTSAARQKVYINGMQAMSCAQLEAQPLLVGIRQLQTLTDESKELKSARNAFDKALTDASIDREAAGSAKYVRALGEARNAQARANEYGAKLALTSGNVTSLVDRIAEQVDKNLIDTEASPQSLQAIVDGFAAQSRAFNKAALPTSAEAAATGTEVAKAQAGGRWTTDNTKNAGANEKKTLAVERTYARLLFAIDALNTTMEDVVTVAEVTHNIQECRADAVANKFIVDPSDAVVTLKLGAKQEFKVTNEVAMPTVALTGQNVESVTLGDVVARDGSFIVSVTGKVVNGDAGPTLVITDGTGQLDKRIVVNVVTADEPAAGGPAAGGTPAEPADAELSEQLSPEETQQLVESGLGKATDDAAIKPVNALKVVQCVADLTGDDIDGKMGPKTRAAIKKFRKTEGPKPAAIDSGLLTDVMTALEADAELCKDFR
jgi:hypothetical protein